MKKIFPILLLLPTILFAQQPSKCDSIIINCCTISDTNSNYLILQASNYSADLIDYPGFILFDGNGDTAAMETVNYFGISQGPQPHWLKIHEPINFPLSGVLQLWSGFFTTLECTYSVTLTDTTLALVENDPPKVRVYPNPAAKVVIIDNNGYNELQRCNLIFLTVTGKETYRTTLNGPETRIPTGLIGPKGIYFMQISTSGGQVMETIKLVLE